MMVISFLPLFCQGDQHLSLIHISGSSDLRMYSLTSLSLKFPAAVIVSKEIEAYIAQRQQDMENTGDQSIQFELTSLNQEMCIRDRTEGLC